MHLLNNPRMPLPDMELEPSGRVERLATERACEPSGAALFNHKC